MVADSDLRAIVQNLELWKDLGHAFEQVQRAMSEVDNPRIQPSTQQPDVDRPEGHSS
jgi:hypothetical protein